MNYLAVLQARMGSTRFPGKVLSEIAGEPMIVRQIERIRRCSFIDELVVATSTDDRDDILVDILKKENVETIRGPLDNVLERFVMAIRTYDPKAVIRLTADCPLTSPLVIDQVVHEFHNSKFDYVSNTLEPTFPDGLDVEVVRPDVLLQVAEFSEDPDELEHVTLGVYRRATLFGLRNVKGQVNHSNLRWTVDTPQDLEFVRKIYNAFLETKPDFEYEDIIELLALRPSLNRTSEAGERNAALRGLELGAMTRVSPDETV